MTHLFTLTLLMAWSAVGTADTLVGSWQLDASRSALSGRMNGNAAAARQKLDVTVDGDVVTATFRTEGGPAARAVEKEEYRLDGVERPFTPLARMGSGPARGTRVSTWSGTGRTSFAVVESVTRDFGNGPVTVRNEHAWTLGLDGSLTIVSVTKGPAGDIPTRRVFVRIITPP